jgi:hypothetical protein
LWQVLMAEPIRFFKAIMLLSVLLSTAPWMYTLIFATGVTRYDTSAQLYISGFIGAISLVITGPFAAWGLSVSRVNRGMSLWHCFLYYVLITAPILSFQAAAPASMMPGFLWFPEHLLTGVMRIVVLGASATVPYTLYFLIIYYLATISRSAALRGAIACSAFTLFAIALYYYIA